MKLDVLYLIFLGYFIELSEESGGGGHHKLVKIIVPSYHHKHTHKHTIIKKVPVHVGHKKHVVVHKHNHKHNHKHDHGHKHGHHHKHKHGHKHGHKHKGHHDHKHKHKHNHKHEKGHGHHYTHGNLEYGHYQPESPGLSHFKSSPRANLEEQKSFYNDDFLNPLEHDEDGFKTSKKSVRSEHYEIQRYNPNAAHEDDKYIVRGAYKVQEGDPETEVPVTSIHTYDSPSEKALAQVLANFGGKYDNLLPFKEENRQEEQQQAQEEEEGEGEGEGQSAADHEDVTDDEDNDDNNQIQYQNYEDYGDNTEVVRAYSHPKQKQLPPGASNYDEIEKLILQQIYGNPGAK